MRASAIGRLTGSSNTSRSRTTLVSSTTGRERERGRGGQGHVDFRQHAHPVPPGRPTRARVRRRAILQDSAHAKTPLRGVCRRAVRQSPGPTTSRPPLSAPRLHPAAHATGRGGAAATVDVRATAAAIEILRAGGNAVDAAVAAASVLGVTDPYSCGIGGGGFMVVYLAGDQRVFTLDHRETAPRALNRARFYENGEPIPFDAVMTSGLSVGVPGSLMGWSEALRATARGRSPTSSSRHPRRRAGLRRGLHFVEQTSPQPRRFRVLPEHRRALPRARRAALARGLHRSRTRAGEDVPARGPGRRPRLLSGRDCPGHRRHAHPSPRGPRRLAPTCAPG